MPHYLMPDGEKLYIREFGQGTPVLVLSGLGMQSWQWLPFLYQHRKKYRFYIPDWRGFGGSAQCKIPTLDAISSHWQDLNCFLNQYADTAFHVIAYSMGATTAMHGIQYGHFKDHIRSYLHIDQTPASQECKSGTFYGVDIKKATIANFASLSQIKPVQVCLVQILEHRVFRHLALNNVA